MAPVQNDAPHQIHDSRQPVVTIRQFQQEDLKDVVTLFSDGMMYYAQEGHPQYTVWVDYIKETLATDLADVEGHYMARDGNFWVATMLPEHGNASDVNSSEPVTVGILGINKKPDGVGELRRMSVKLEYRRYGIGKRLIDHVEQWAKAHSYTMLTLSNGNMMTQAHNFYYKLGYKYTITTVLCPDPFYEVMHFEKYL
uniref:N-acetyltransferase domain-containing protein n=1 Tax=Globisporangium ultimum (strain ATCC 200006 / CBS 805.95 / DAOM BR144) TaxID=431595 RepID=K3XAQ8_GLOUD